MSEDDKYPPESGRRRFVKGVVGGGALAGVGATGAVSVNTLTTASGAGGGTVKARVVENTGGPAPRGMPQIPIEIDDDGFIKGIWPEITTDTVQGVEFEVAREEDFKGSGVTYSQEWFQYCGLESNNALVPSYDSDNYFVATESSDYAWQQDRNPRAIGLTSAILTAIRNGVTGSAKRDSANPDRQSGDRPTPRTWCRSGSFALRPSKKPQRMIRGSKQAPTRVSWRI